MDTPLLSVGDAARYLGVSSQYVSKLAGQGRMGRRIAGRWAFTAEELDRFAAAPKQRGRRRQGSRPPRSTRVLLSSGSDLVPQVEAYLLEKRLAGRSPKTIRALNQRLGAFLAFLGPRPFTKETVRAYARYLVDERHLHPISIAGYLSSLHTFADWLVAEGVLDGNPVAKTLIPKLPTRKPASYNLPQIQALLGVCGPRDRALILTLLDTGLRLSEIISLRRDRIDWQSGRFTVIGKGNKERSGWISPPVLHAIQAYLATRRDTYPALWVGMRGPLTDTGVYQIIKRRVMQAGIRGDVRRLVHGCRATFAKLYIQRGGDLGTLAAHLGHSTLDMSRYYSQLDETELAAKKAAVNPIAAVLEPA